LIHANVKADARRSQPACEIVLPKWDNCLTLKCQQLPASGFAAGAARDETLHFLEKSAHWRILAQDWRNWREHCCI
jgi:hypothetical protein